jgi:hypothetical protein
MNIKILLPESFIRAKDIELSKVPIYVDEIDLHTTIHGEEQKGRKENEEPVSDLEIISSVDKVLPLILKDIATGEIPVRGTEVVIRDNRSDPPLNLICGIDFFDNKSNEIRVITNLRKKNFFVKTGTDKVYYVNESFKQNQENIMKILTFEEFEKKMLEGVELTKGTKLKHKKFGSSEVVDVKKENGKKKYVVKIGDDKAEFDEESMGDFSTE